MRKKQMISLIFSMAAAGTISSGVNLAVCAEEAATGTMTVTIYDGETDELFQSDDAGFYLLSGNYDTRPKFGEFKSASGLWHVTDGNPYTVTDIEIRPGWIYFLELNNANCDGKPYYYEIDESRSVSECKFTDSTEQTLEIYLVKHYRNGTRGGFWVYLGEDETDHAPVFAHYYISSDSAKEYRRAKVIYRGAMDHQLSYGDILETEDVVNPVHGVLSEDVAWSFKGNCTELGEIRTLTVGNENIQSNSNQNSRWMVLYDGDSFFYSTTAYVEHYQPDISLEDVQCGDTIEYAVYENIPILPLTSPEHHHPAGDVSADNLFRKSDLVLMQEWLLSEPDTVLTDWKAGDRSGDGVLNAVDLTLMKQELLEQEQQPHCTLTLTTTQSGTSVMGEKLEPRISEDSFTVYANDRFLESNCWIQNPLQKSAIGGLIAVIDNITEKGVSLRLFESNQEVQTITVPYGNEVCKGSNFVVFDGYNSTYTLVFSDYSADGMTNLTPPEKMPAIICQNGSVSAAECKALWDYLQKRYPDADLSDFTLRYDPKHPMRNYIDGKMFRVYYKDIRIHGYGDLNLDGNVYASIGKTTAGKLIADVNLLAEPAAFAAIDTDTLCLSKDEISQLYQHTLFDSEPERIIYADVLHDTTPEFRLAYRIAYAEIAEVIVDAVTGEEIEYISYVVP